LILEEVRVVRALFRWIALEGLSLRAATRRLEEQQIPTRTGKARWDPATIRGILLNPAYHGEAHWGKTRLEPRVSARRPSRGQPEQPRREKVAQATPVSEHEIILVPALVSRDLFDAVAEKLEENRKQQRIHQTGASFLLSGLLRCGKCGGAYCGRQHKSGQKRLVYYRCLGTDKSRHGGETLCDNTAVGGNVEDEVWTDLCALLQDPQRLREQLQQRHEVAASSGTPDESLCGSVSRLKGQLARLMDMYEGEFMDKATFDVRAGRVKERLLGAEKACAEQMQAQQRAEQEKTLLMDFEQFATQVKTGLTDADFPLKRRILNLLIQRIDVGEEAIQIIYKVQPHPFVPSPNRGDLQHRLKFHATPSG
jgi:site-specific DNA recombinase